MRDFLRGLDEGPPILPSREVMRENLMDIYAHGGIDRLADLLDYIVLQLREGIKPQPNPDWVVHYAQPGIRCCHIHVDDDSEVTWQGAAEGTGAAMVLAIEDFVDWCRGDGLPSIGDRG